MLKKIGWILLVSAVLWLCMVMPSASLFALLSQRPLPRTLMLSVAFMPLVFALVMVVFRSRNSRIRWWVFQYLGISSITMNAAFIGIILSLFLSSLVAGFVAVLLAILFCLYGIRAAHRIVEVPLKLTSPKVKKPLRLIQLSDVHIGSRRPALLEKIVRQCNALQPDIVLITGDLVDENKTRLELVALQQLACPVVYCSGNHERYIDYEKTLSTLQSLDIKVLSDCAIELKGLRFIGIQDRDNPEAAADILSQFDTETSEDLFTVLLYHQPSIWETCQKLRIDLMLSGHTHNGQVWPFGILVRLRYRYSAGHYNIGPQHLFVSQGTGTWGPVMRFGTRCEMTVIDLQTAPG